MTVAYRGGRRAGRLDLRRHAAGADAAPRRPAARRARRRRRDHAEQRRPADARVRCRSPPTSVRMTSRSASTSVAVSAERLSLSPNLISSTGDGVVLVDDRHGAQLEQGAQRVARVQVAAAVGEVGVRQQHLRDLRSCSRERALVDAMRPAARPRPRPAATRAAAAPAAEPRRTGGDRAGADHHDLAPRRRGRRRRRRSRRCAPAGPAVAREHVAADLDDDAPHALQQRGLVRALLVILAPRAVSSTRHASAPRGATRRQRR